MILFFVKTRELDFICCLISDNSPGYLLYHTMLEQRLIELLTRKMAGELSSQELAELNEILETYPWHTL